MINISYSFFSALTYFSAAQGLVAAPPAFAKTDMPANTSSVVAVEPAPLPLALKNDVLALQPTWQVERYNMRFTGNLPTKEQRETVYPVETIYTTAIDTAGNVVSLVLVEK